jgi:hypothetical protein
VTSDILTRRHYLQLVALLYFVLSPLIYHQPGLVIAATLLLFPFIFCRQRFSGWLTVLIKFSLLAGYAVAIKLNYSPFISQSSAVSFFIATVLLKCFEMRTRRELYIVLALGFFGLGVNFLFYQGIPSAVFMLLGLSGLMYFLIMLSAIGTNSKMREFGMAKFSLMLVVISIPLMSFFYVAFPRLPTAQLGLPNLGQALSGLSEDMSPGDIAKLNQDNSVAFRVDFLEGEMPPEMMRYFRVYSLSLFDGIKWSQGEKRNVGAIDYATEQGSAVAYQITMEPQKVKALPSLDYLIDSNNRRVSDEGMVPTKRKALTARMRYKLTSVPGLSEFPVTRLSSREEAYYRTLPENNPRLIRFGQQLAGRPLSDVVAELTATINQQPYWYTLSPPLLPEAGRYDHFWFETQRGFCAHYASAVAIILRAAGFPARVVTGYQGGEVNDVGQYLIVRQSDAHAWVEVWSSSSGWQRFDPTAAISDLRVEEQLQQDVAERAGSSVSIGSGIGWLQKAVWRWDYLNHQWHQMVLGYDHERQKELLQKLGLAANQWHILLIAMVVILLLFVAVVALFAIPRHRLTPLEKAFGILDQSLAMAAPESLHKPPYSKLVVAEKLVAEKLVGEEGKRLAQRYRVVRYRDGSSANELVPEIRELAKKLKK